MSLVSLYDEASLWMTPSGAKDGKLFSELPTDGGGDFTFSRGSNLAATRVGADGLIEKGRENLTYNSDWSGVSTDTNPTGWTQFLLGTGTFDATGTSGQIRLQTSDASSRVIIYSNTIGTNGILAVSVYVDAVATTIPLSNLISRSATSTQLLAFEDGVEIPYNDNIQAGKRYLVIFNQSAPTEYRFGVGTSSSVLGDVTISRPQIEQGLAATEYIPSPVGATAQAGVLENEPRLDYSGGASCPSLLLEPQRSNVVSQSEYFGDSSWNNSNAVTRSISSISSPEGKLNAYDIIPTTANTNHTLRAPNLSGFTSGAVVNVSFFAKANGYKFISVVGGFGSSSTPTVVFNLDEGAIESGTGTIEDYGSGWYRCVSPITLNATALYCVGTILNDSQSGSFAGDGTSAISVYGFQIEQASYPTSYIPTYGTSQTRLKDSAVKTGISSLIGQTEGTIFAEAKIAGDDASNRRLINVSDGSSATRIELYAKSNTSRMQLAISAGGTDSVALLSSSVGFDTTFKIAVAYASNDCAFYVNGTLVGTDSSVVVPSTSKITFGRGDNVFEWQGKINQTLLFKTRLTNAELAALTKLG